MVAVGYYYHAFGAVSEEEVADLLAGGGKSGSRRG